ncbi:MULTISPECIES: helix-turn-helix domain-containing protein [Bosea]|jgi:transcriptional regulator with XRE-family HTH domain|uniref:helix-turn-helix domain-containing protein n=1 Tax=Bosea TaxID=85413 RepID=UPI00214F8116|nr:MULTISPECIES: helix-turn-helix transcriptional regulator [Bosea]MCR4523544.1 helix-turn-helix domain-containing protein [Bosea sp. 47.2.35]MDR6830418.1 transcriptional regulator with XRE-family HTH domain [Bosea robiniae]MDR6897173.1 transcriptional regulator with XRE-family HTH domain [Bosea sp. BE109]MDR7140639.1 transcriptional regulator with XRE-family HTH domain [Bosea sp. BE168]MDR7177336.1 transcriptional regulator with XRE-family HTH domain [Bosea sp. BE271]
MRTEAEAINRHIGDRLRILRKKRGLSQADLGAVLDVSFQQMGNYEKGKDRISAGALFMLARFLGTSPAAFFEGLAPAETGFAEDAADYPAASERPPQSDKLDAAFGRIRSQRDRALAVALVETIARRDESPA